METRQQPVVNIKTAAVHPASTVRPLRASLPESSGQADCHTRTWPLPLLPSGPGGVGGRFFAQGPNLHRPEKRTWPEDWRPRPGIQPHWSGLWVQGTASSPLSTGYLKII